MREISKASPGIISPGRFFETHREIAGAIHIHTTYSDGSRDIGDCIRTAQGLGLDYIAITDHMSLGGLGQQGFHDGLYVLVGYEHNDPENRNHYLALGIDAVFKDAVVPQEYINRIQSAGGVGILAHPFEKRHYFKGLPAFPWTAWDAVGFDGLEIWNQISDWVEKLKSLFSFIRFFYPRRFLEGVYPEALAKWDELNCTRFVAGIGGVDAHARRLSIGPFWIEIFPLKIELKGIRTHLYIEKSFSDDNPTGARRMLLDAIRNGHGYVSNFRWGDARGARIILCDADGLERGPGRYADSPYHPGSLSVNLPCPATIRLVKNGACIQSQSSNSASFEISDPGIYRIEALRNGHAWIYSNPFPVGSYPIKG
jgi:hypothetical protein